MLRIFVIVLIHGNVLSAQRSAENSLIYIRSSEQKSDKIITKEFPYTHVTTEKRYIFRGEQNERIQIKFGEILFDEKKSAKCSESESYVKYKNKVGRSFYLCGVIREPKPIMSDSNEFELEYKIVENAKNSNSVSDRRGFNATFSFVKNYGIESGFQEDEDKCEFLYDFKNKTNGIFYSPNYPGFYPKNIECSFFFDSSYNNTIKIKFSSFNLLGSENCGDYQNDYVEVTDTIDGNPTSFSLRICGKHNNNYEINRNVSFLLIKFHSTDYDDTLLDTENDENVGFYATFELSDVSSSRKTVAYSINIMIVWLLLIKMR